MTFWLGIRSLRSLQPSQPHPRSSTETASFLRCYGSEFINWHLQAWCKRKEIQLTRGRPYQKDDNAHVEQKNWTHVRKLLGWDRYDSPDAVEAINDLYRNELRLWLNLYLPSVKQVKKVRVGSKLRRVYDAAQTPLERVSASPQAHGGQVAELRILRRSLDPFGLAKVIDQKLERIYKRANQRLSPKAPKEVLAPKQTELGGENGCGKAVPARRDLKIPSGFSLSHSRDGGASLVTLQMARRSTPGLHSSMA
jgi:transposase InsO family protein